MTRYTVANKADTKMIEWFEVGENKWVEEYWEKDSDGEYILIHTTEYLNSVQVESFSKKLTAEGFEVK